MTWRSPALDALASRAFAVLLLYASAACIGSVLFAFVWEQSPVGRAVEDFVAALPAPLISPPAARTAPGPVVQTPPSAPPEEAASPVEPEVPVALSEIAPALVEPPAIEELSVATEPEVTLPLEEVAAPADVPRLPAALEPLPAPPQPPPPANPSRRATGCRATARHPGACAGAGRGACDRARCAA